MKTLKTDEFNNLIFVCGSPGIVQGVDCAAQSMRCRIGLVIGENPDNEDQGIDYFTQFAGVFGGGDYLLQSVRDAAISDPDNEITMIKNIDIGRQNREVKITIKAVSIYGQFEI